MFRDVVGVADVPDDPWTQLRLAIEAVFRSVAESLQFQDFQALAGKNAVMAMPKTPVGGWYSKGMGSAYFGYINKAGITQFRLRFAKDDNDDMSADYLKFYSGNYATAAYRPILIIKYYVP